MCQWVVLCTCVWKYYCVCACALIFNRHTRKYCIIYGGSSPVTNFSWQNNQKYLGSCIFSLHVPLLHQVMPGIHENYGYERVLQFEWDVRGASSCPRWSVEVHQSPIFLSLRNNCNFCVHFCRPSTTVPTPWTNSDDWLAHWEATL